MIQPIRLPLLAICLVYAGLGCSAPDYSGPAVGPFKDNPTSNREVEPGQLELVFVDGEGKQVDLRQYRGRKNVVLVVMRGFGDAICPNCTAQTSRLVSNYRDFARRDAEVLVVFPGPTEHLQEFLDSARAQASNAPLPFPLLLDKDFAGVDQLGIRGNLAKPSTFILDKKGQVRFAYVGAYTTDRPSVKALLAQLDAIAKD